MATWARVYPETDSFSIGATDIPLTRYYMGGLGSYAQVNTQSYKGTIVSCKYDETGNTVVIVGRFLGLGVPEYTITLTFPAYGYRDSIRCNVKITTDVPTIGGQYTQILLNKGIVWEIYQISIQSPEARPTQFVNFELSFSGGEYTFSNASVEWSIETKKEGSTTNLLPPLLLPKKHPPRLHILWYSDNIGSNLGEIVCIVQGNYLINDRYPTKLIGKYSWFRVDRHDTSYFSKHTNFLPVMRGEGDIYYARAQQLNDTSLPTTEFYTNLLSFMSIRYYLGGLTSGNLARKWLLQRNTKNLYANILRSEFSVYLPLLITTYKGYDKYMKY